MITLVSPIVKLKITETTWSPQQGMSGKREPFGRQNQCCGPGTDRIQIDWSAP